jgi:hypothetical protein
MPPDVVVGGLITHRKPPEVRIWRVRFPSQNANGVVACTPNDPISRPTRFTDREFTSRFVGITAGFDVAER